MSFNLQVNVPGLEREITLGEMIELKLIDHTKTIVKSRRSNRYVSTRDALKEGDIDPLTGMYGNMNLLEARSKGYLLSTDAMVSIINLSLELYQFSHFSFLLIGILLCVFYERSSKLCHVPNSEEFL